MKDVLLAIGAIVGTLLVVVVLAFFGLEMRRYFAPAHEEVRRQTFMESSTYQRGVIERLNQVRMEYRRAEAAGNAAHMEMFRERALTEYATVDLARVELPRDLQAWINEIQR